MKRYNATTLQDLLEKYAQKSVYERHEDFIDEFLTNLEIYPETVSIGPIQLSTDESREGYEIVFISEMEAIVQATTFVTKEHVLSVGLEEGSVKHFIENDMDNIVRSFSDKYNDIENLFFSHLTADGVLNSGITEEYLRGILYMNFNCILLEADVSEDNDHYIFKLQFSV